MSGMSPGADCPVRNWLSSIADACAKVASAARAATTQTYAFKMDPACIPATSDSHRQHGYKKLCRMLKSAALSNFTSVPSGKWQFSPGLNVIVGENGLGKSHVLKALYSALKSLTPDNNSFEGGAPDKLGKSHSEKRIADELIGNMRPDTLGRLVKRQQGRNRSEISLRFHDKSLNIDFGFATNSRSQVEITRMPTGHLDKTPVFIPTRELITLCPWFVSLYDSYSVPFEKTWRDTVSLLGAPSLRGPREAKVRGFLSPIEDAMGGKVEVDANGRFFLKVNGGKMEAALGAVCI